MKVFQQTLTLSRSLFVGLPRLQQDTSEVAKSMLSKLSDAEIVELMKRKEVDNRTLESYVDQVGAGTKCEACFWCCAVLRVDVNNNVLVLFK